MLGESKESHRMLKTERKIFKQTGEETESLSGKMRRMTAEEMTVTLEFYFQNSYDSERGQMETLPRKLSERSLINHPE